MNPSAEITICLIKSNDFKFTKELYYNNINKLQDDISQFIEIRKILFSDMMETIVTFIGLTPELIGNSPICFETSKNIFQLCYAETHNNNLGSTNTSTLPENNICSYLSGEKVYGNASFLNSLVSSTGTCIPDNMSLEILTNILYSKFVHKGIYISSNNDSTPIEFDYFNHPIEYYNVVTESEFDNYKIVDIDFLEFNLCMIIELNPSNDIINKSMTRLYGKQKINGNVILISKITHEYHDLTLDLYKKITKLSFGSLKSRELTNIEKKDEPSANQLPVVINKYTILENRYTNLKNECHHCKSPFGDSELTCGGCYRVKYHTVDCQKTDWNNHKNDCLYNKDFMNKKN